MIINIRGNKVSITNAMKEQIENKFKRLEKYFEDPSKINVHVNIKVTKDVQTIEVTIPTNKFTVRSEESHEDLYTAIDLILDKIERQIRKNKTKLQRKYKNVEPIDFNLDWEDTEKIEENKIVKRKNIEMKPMDEEEAIIQAELLGHDFFIFKNIDEECVSVIYKRKDGRFGIINVK